MASKEDEKWNGFSWHWPHSRQIPAQPNGREVTPSEFSDYVISIVEEVANLHWVVSSCKRERDGNETWHCRYRVSHLVIALGLVDFDLSVPPFCPAANTLLPNSHQPRQSWADSGTIQFEVNQIKSTTRCDTLYNSRIKENDIH